MAVMGSRGGFRIFVGGGVANDYVCARTSRARRRSPKSLTAEVVDTLSCYLSLIFKHSTKLDIKKNTVDQILGGRKPVAPLPPPPPL